MNETKTVEKKRVFYPKRILVAIVLSLAILSSAFFLLQKEGLIDLRVYATGDAISYFQVDQYNGTDWNLMLNATASGQSASILDSQPLNFTIQVKLDILYASTASQAQTYTWIGMNITYGGGPTYVWTNVTLNDTAVGGVYSDASFWYVRKLGNWTSSLPIAGTTYNCTAEYRAYY